MNEYKVEYSYIREDGRRMYETDITMAGSAAQAAAIILSEVKEMLSEYEGLSDPRIEQVWIDRGRAWELREFEF